MKLCGLVILIVGLIDMISGVGWVRFFVLKVKKDGEWNYFCVKLKVSIL